MKKAWGFVFASTLLLLSSNVQATDSRSDITAEIEKPTIRGGIVYKSYCSTCHGPRGDGVGARASKLYGNVNIDKTLTTAQVDAIVRKGGAAVGKSPFMPMWEEELSEEQLRDVVSYLVVLPNQIPRGEVVFKTNCILCHGVKGDGQGRASVLYNPRPANLTKSDKNDMYKKMIITMGGAAMGRSSVMPIWGLQLTEYEIDDVVAYLRTLLVVPPPP